MAYGNKLNGRSLDQSLKSLLKLFPAEQLQNDELTIRKYEQ